MLLTTMSSPCTDRRGVGALPDRAFASHPLARPLAQKPVKRRGNARNANAPVFISRSEWRTGSPYATRKATRMSPSCTTKLLSSPVMWMKPWFASMQRAATTTTTPTFLSSYNTGLAVEISDGSYTWWFLFLLLEVLPLTCPASVQRRAPRRCRGNVVDRLYGCWWDELRASVQPRSCPSRYVDGAQSARESGASPRGESGGRCHRGSRIAGVQVHPKAPEC